MAISDVLSGVLNSQKPAKQSDVVAEFRSRYPRYTNIPDDELAGKIADTFPKYYSFLKNYEPDSDVPVDTIRKSAEDDIAEFKSKYPRYKDEDPETLAPRMEQAFPTKYGGLSDRLKLTAKPKAPEPTLPEEPGLKPKTDQFYKAFSSIMGVASPVQAAVLNIPVVRKQLARKSGAFAQGGIDTVADTIAFVPAASEYVFGKQGPTKDLLKVSEWMSRQAQEIAPDDPTFLDKLASGGGSFAMFALSSLIGGGAGAAGAKAIASSSGLISRIPAATKLLTLMGRSMGMAAPTLFESATESGGAFKDELAKGASPEDASVAAKRNFLANVGVIAATQILPVPAGRTAIKNAIYSAPKEGVQEGFQALVNMVQDREVVDWPAVFRQIIKDPAKLAQIGEAAGIGAILGGGVGAAGTVVQRKGILSKETTDPGTIKKITEVPGLPEVALNKEYPVDQVRLVDAVDDAISAHEEALEMNVDPQTAAVEAVNTFVSEVEIAAEESSLAEAQEIDIADLEQRRDELEAEPASNEEATRELAAINAEIESIKSGKQQAAPPKPPTVEETIERVQEEVAPEIEEAGIELEEERKAKQFIADKAAGIEPTVEPPKKKRRLSKKAKRDIREIASRLRDEHNTKFDEGAHPFVKWLSEVKFSPNKDIADELRHTTPLSWQRKGMPKFDERVQEAINEGLLPEGTNNAQALEIIKKRATGRRLTFKDFLIEAEEQYFETKPGQRKAKQAAERITAGVGLSKDVVVEAVDAIMVDEEAYRSGYKEEFSKSQKEIRGVYYPQRYRGLIQLASGATDFTGYHEAFHAVQNLVATEQELRFLDRAFRDRAKGKKGVREVQADAFADYMKTKTTGIRLVDRIFAKIESFLRNLKRYFKQNGFGETLDAKTKEIFDKYGRIGLDKKQIEGRRMTRELKRAAAQYSASDRLDALVPAVRFNGRVYAGTQDDMHADIYGRLLERGLMKASEFDDGESGFYLKSKDQFMDREEALDYVSFKRGERDTIFKDEKWLDSEEIRMTKVPQYSAEDRQTFDERFQQRVRQARQQGLSEEEARQFAKDKMGQEERTRFERESKPKMVQAEFGDAGGVRSFGKGRQGEGELPLYSAAYHGTPHKIDQFSLNKIGTGQGAQTFGWGLYFAEKREVAETYREQLSGPIIIKNMTIGDFRAVQREEFLDYEPRGNGIYERVRASVIEDVLVEQSGLEAAYAQGGNAGATEFVLDIIDDKVEQYQKEYEEGVAPLREFRSVVERRGVRIDAEVPGRIYKVDLAPNENEYLYWDKKLVKHDPAIQSKFDRIKKDLGRSIPEMEENINVPFQEWTGQELYHVISGHASESPLPGDSPSITSHEEAASRYLARIGVPGIKFLDQGSRDKGSGTYNYVIFDDRFIEILDSQQKQYPQYSAEDKQGDTKAVSQPLRGNLDSRLKQSQTKSVVREVTGQKQIDEKRYTESHALRRALQRESIAAAAAYNQGRQDIQGIKKKIVNVLTEFLSPDQRGRYVSALAGAKTGNDVAKIAVRVSNDVEKSQKKFLINQIKKQGDAAVESRAVAVDYRQRIAELLDTALTAKPRQDTLNKAAKLQEYISRQARQGRNVSMPMYVMEKLRVLNTKPLADMSIAELEDFYSKLSQLAQMGKVKWETRQELAKLRRERDVADLKAGTNAINSKDLEVAFPGEKLTTNERMQNVVSRLFNFQQNKGLALTPTDVVFDMLDGLQDFDGPNSRIFKQRIDSDFSNYLREADLFVSKARDLARGLDESNFNRIGFYATARQEGGAEKLMNLGYTAEEIKSVTLTDHETAVYNEMRRVMDRTRPLVAQVMRDVYNADMGEVRNYFPFVTDWSLMNDQDMKDRMLEEMIGLRSNVEASFTKERQGAGKQKIKLNAWTVFTKHMDDVAYLINVQPTLKHLSDIARSEEYANAAGDVGQSFVREWIDTMARKGGVEGAKRIAALDTIRRNTGAAVLAYKLSTAVIQLMAVNQGAARIGGYAYKGLWNTTDRRWREFVLDNMPEVRFRIGDDPAYRDATWWGPLETLRRGGFWLLQKLDRAAAGAVASGAYEKYMNDHGLKVDLANPNKDAIAYAQRMTRRTQASPYFKDQPGAITRGKMTGNVSMDRALFQFQNFMLNEWSLIRHEGLRSIGAGDYKRGIGTLMGIIMAAFIEQFGRKLMRDAGNAMMGYKPPREFPFMVQMAKEMTGKIPFIPQLYSLFLYGNPVGIPSLQAIHELSAGTVSATVGKRPETRRRGLIRTAGALATLAGIPGAAPLARTIKKSTYTPPPYNPKREIQRQRREYRERILGR